MREGPALLSVPLAESKALAVGKVLLNDESGLPPAIDGIDCMTDDAEEKTINEEL